MRHLLFCLQLMVGVLYVLQSSSAGKVYSTKCPQNCLCLTPKQIECINVSLTKIPKDISESVSLIDLSRNPALRIEKKSFEKFRVLTTLKLESCNLNVPFTVPRNLRYAFLSDNKLNYNQFYTTFSGGSPFLKVIGVSDNQIHITSRKPLLNATNLQLVSLFMNINVMRVIYKETFRGFFHLRLLDLQFMGVEKIEKEAFADLFELKSLNLAGNQLSGLPQNLFKSAVRLSALCLDNNKLLTIPDLTGVPRNMFSLYLGYNYITDISSLPEMGVKFLVSLSIPNNNIAILPKYVFQNLSVTNINLAGNKIKELQDYSFTACTHVLSLYLDSNELFSISPKAFSAVGTISSLSLSNNKLQVIPPRLFSNLRGIGWAFLHNNNISSIKDAWKDIRSPPKLILLFGNPIQVLSTNSLKGLGSHTEIHISCDTLFQISEIQRLKPVIRCSPSESFYMILHLTIAPRVLNGLGLNCILLKKEYSLTFNCTPCSLGFYGNGTSCRKCPAGSFYQDKLVKTSCKQCPLGQYVAPENAPGKRALDCQTCPEGTQSGRSADYRACFCLPDFARQSRFGPCKRCTSPGITCTNDYQMLKPGFWWSWEYDAACKAKYQAFINNLETFNDSYSIETCSFNCKMPLPHKCPNKLACLGTVHGSCQQNYTGPLCTMCAKKYYRHFRMCIRCPKEWIAALEFLTYLLAFIVICTAINWADKITVKTKGRISCSENGSNKFMVQQQALKQRTVADVILSTLKILIGFYQILSGIVQSFPDIPWPHSFTTLLRIFQFFELQILRFPSLRCIRPKWHLNAIDEFWLSLGITFLIPFIIGAYYIIRRAYLDKTVITQRVYTESVEMCRKQCVRSIILFLFATFPSTSRRIFQILPIACHKLCFNTSRYCVSYLRADYSVKCLSASSENNWILYLAYASLIVPFGFIGFLLVSLAYTKDNKQIDRQYKVNDAVEQLVTSQENCQTNIHPITSRPNQSNNETTFQFALKFCHENYHPSCWYWEITEMVRKLLFTSILPLISPFSNIFLGLSIIVAGFFAVLHAYRKPIQNYLEHWLQMVSLSAVPANLCIAHILNTSTTQHFTLFNPEEEDLGITIILILLNSALIMVVFLQFAVAQTRKLKKLWQQY